MPLLYDAMPWLKKLESVSHAAETHTSGDVADTRLHATSTTLGAFPSDGSRTTRDPSKSPTKKKNVKTKPMKNQQSNTTLPEAPPREDTTEERHAEKPTQAAHTKITFDMSSMDKRFLETENASIKRVSGMATAVSFTQRKAPTRKLRHQKYMSIAAQHLTYSMIYHVYDGSQSNIEDLDTSKPKFDSANMQSFRILSTIMSNMHTKRAHVQAIELELMKACLATNLLSSI